MTLNPTTHPHPRIDPHPSQGSLHDIGFVTPPGSVDPPPKKWLRAPGARNFGRIATKAVAFEAHDRDALYDTSYVVIGQELRKREPKDFENPRFSDPVGPSGTPLIPVGS